MSTYETWVVELVDENERLKELAEIQKKQITELRKRLKAAMWVDTLLDE